MSIERLSRRDFGKLALAAIPLARAAGKINSKIDGVQLGAQTYSFRDRPLDGAIAGMKEVGLGECELFMGHVEPRGMRGEVERLLGPRFDAHKFHDFILAQGLLPPDLLRKAVLDQFVPTLKPVMASR